MNGIKFLGTAGARHAVTRQLRASGGIWYNLDGTQVLIDPGPGSLVRALSSRPKLDPSTLDGIVLSHRHIDHTTDVNIMIEAMTSGGTKRRGTLVAPRDALEEDPVVLLYLRDHLDKIETISDGSRFSIGEITVEFPVRNVHHGVEAYGYRIHWSGGTICHIVDTHFFPELSAAYRGNILILNVLLHDPDDQAVTFIDHLNINDARRLISEIKPDRAILTHFGMKMLREKPHELADSIAKETGIEVIAAYDEMMVRL